MTSTLSPKYEAFIAEQLAEGTYPSRQRLLEAALDLLSDETASSVPEEHIVLLEEAEADIAAGRISDWDPEAFLRRLEELRRAGEAGNT
jgi:Arc/MetJ-type ribon-helix-helix transcriptional regulator